MNNGGQKTKQWTGKSGGDINRVDMIPQGLQYTYTVKCKLSSQEKEQVISGHQTKRLICTFSALCCYSIVNNFDTSEKSLSCILPTVNMSYL